ncbi:MAG: PD40 domain-containing protein [Thermoflexales bacterium]|nr:PD40 domain-containing protein [Thermoflexales bacterium]
MSSQDSSLVQRGLAALVIVLLVSVLPACARATPAPLPTLAAEAVAAPTEAVAAPTQAPAAPTQAPAAPTEAAATSTPPPPTATPEPEADQASAPLGALNRDGPWLVFAAPDGLWALDADGSDLTQLTRRPLVAPGDLRTAVSPRGGQLAFITAADPQLWKDLALELLRLPGGQIETVTPLASATAEAGLEAGPDAPAFQALRAVAELPSLAWSPNGQQVAFMSVHEGPSSDLYVYSIEDSHLTRLTDGPSQGFRPSWSPDGKYIVHAGAESFGTGAGYSMAGMWAARADGSEVKSLYTPSSGDEVVIGWSAPDTFVVYSWSSDCGARTLRTFNVESSQVGLLWEDYFNEVALDPASGGVLLAVDKLVASCNPGGQAGVFLVTPGEGAVRRVAGFEASALSWSPDAGVFLLQAQEVVWTVTLGGELTPLPGPAVPLLTAPPLAAPAGQGWAWSTTEEQGQPGVWVGKGEGDPLQVSSLPADEAVWGTGGQSLFFWADGGLYRASGPDFSPELVIEGVQISPQGAVWVWP